MVPFCHKDKNRRYILIKKYFIESNKKKSENVFQNKKGYYICTLVVETIIGEMAVPIVIGR